MALPPPTAALWVESTAAIEEDDAAAPDVYRLLRPAPGKDTARTKSHKSMDAETGVCCVWEGGGWGRRRAGCFPISRFVAEKFGARA